MQGGEQAVERRARAVQACARVDEREQARAPITGRAGLHDASGMAPDCLLVDLLDEPLLGPEVVVEGALRHADVRRDRIEARAWPVLGETLDGGVEKFVAQGHTYSKVSHNR